MPVLKLLIIPFPPDITMCYCCMVNGPISWAFFQESPSALCEKNRSYADIGGFAVRDGCVQFDSSTPMAVYMSSESLVANHCASKVPNCRNPHCAQQKKQQHPPCRAAFYRQVCVCGVSLCVCVFFSVLCVSVHGMCVCVIGNAS